MKTAVVKIVALLSVSVASSQAAQAKCYVWATRSVGPAYQGLLESKGYTVIQEDSSFDEYVKAASSSIPYGPEEGQYIVNVDRGLLRDKTLTLWQHVSGSFRLVASPSIQDNAITEETKSTNLVDIAKFEIQNCPIGK